MFYMFRTLFPLPGGLWGSVPGRNYRYQQVRSRPDFNLQCQSNQYLKRTSSESVFLRDHFQRDHFQRDHVWREHVWREHVQREYDQREHVQNNRACYEQCHICKIANELNIFQVNFLTVSWYTAQQRDSPLYYTAESFSKIADILMNSEPNSKVFQVVKLEAI